MAVEKTPTCLIGDIKRNFGGSTPQVTGKMAPFKRANVLNLEELLQSENGLFRKKTNGTFGVLDIFTKRLCEKKNFVPRS